MQKSQIIVITLALILLLSIFFLGDFIGKNKKKTQQNNQTSTVTESNANEIPFHFDKYKNEAITKLDESKKIRFTTLNNSYIKENSIITTKSLAHFWEHEKNPFLAAYYYKQLAFLENTKKSYTFAGNLYLGVLLQTEQQNIKKWQASEAISCFEKVLEIDPTDNDTKIALATCYTEGTGETMKGVTLLREVTKTDSANISANIILGKMAIQSGQFDKAIRRLELVLSIKPANTEAMYFLAEAYKAIGNKEKAITLFEKCKAIVNNADFTKEIDSYIKTFK